MIPVRLQPDVEQILVDYIAGHRAEDVGTQLPDDWQPGSSPFVQVTLDGTPTVDYPIRCVCTVRVTVWATGRTEARDIAAPVQALLLSHPGDASVQRIGPGVGLYGAKDSRNGGQMASFTVNASLALTAA